MTYATAARILENHGHAYAPSDVPGCILARAEFTLNGSVGYEWEAVRMDIDSLRDWLGY